MNGGEGSAHGARNRATRLPNDWCPDSDAPANQKLHATRADAWLADQLERFRDYWSAKSGKDATKLDWDATWRNWIKRADDYGHSGAKSESRDDAWPEPVQHPAGLYERDAS